MKILSGTQMARLDRLSIRRHGISAEQLMRRAAQACCDEIFSIPKWNPRKKIVIVCGPGNNGGDGFAMAGILRERGIAARIFFLGEEAGLSPEARGFYRAVSGQVALERGKFPSRDFDAALRDAEILVDALFGTGLKRDLRGLHAEAIRRMNRSAAWKLAVDIPSGLSADTGETMGIAFQADKTVTFEVPKWGQILPPAWDSVGDLVVRSIGLSRQELAKFPAKAEWVESEGLKKYFRPRSRRIHKGKAGRVLVLAGSREMPGAGYLTSMAALRAGAGLVHWALPEEAFRKIDLRYPEVILSPLPSEAGGFSLKALPKLKGLIKRFQSLAVGPGMGSGEGLRHFLEEVLRIARASLVLDADALNALAAGKIPKQGLRRAILTPHPLEMARLSGKSVEEILNRPMDSARHFARGHACWVLLKGYRTVIADPRGRVWINSTGGPNLATAGSGDVLTGIIAGLLAQGLSHEGAVLAGAYLHGLAGDRLAKRQGDRGTIATDLLKEIPFAVRELLHG
ncbi:MAG: NAD(P)H-hydrate dehydratase [Deltaproteobacteria bacterium]|nr:NAD(P)H-hydrate dehydratase [Deltaproteobacteria bacterium]